MKRNFFKKGKYKPSVIDVNDPDVKKLLKKTKELQEKNEKLKKIDPSIGDLIIN
jgi:hypothetical protein